MRPEDTTPTLVQIAVRVAREAIRRDMKRRDEYFGWASRADEKFPAGDGPYRVRLAPKLWKPRRGRTAPC